MDPPLFIFSSIFLKPTNNAQDPERRSALVRPATKHPSLWNCFLKPCNLLSHGHGSSFSGLLFLAAIEASPASAIQDIYFPVLNVNWFLLLSTRDEEKLHLCSAAVYPTRFSRTDQGTWEGCHSMAQPEDTGALVQKKWGQRSKKPVWGRNCKMCVTTSFTCGCGQQKRRRCHILKEKVVCKPLVASETRGSLKPESPRCKLYISIWDTTGRIFPHCEPQFLFLGEKSTSGAVETNLDSRWERCPTCSLEKRHGVFAVLGTRNRCEMIPITTVLTVIWWGSNIHTTPSFLRVGQWGLQTPSLCSRWHLKPAFWPSTSILSRLIHPGALSVAPWVCGTHDSKGIFFPLLMMNVMKTLYTSQSSKCLSSKC